MKKELEIKVRGEKQFELMPNGILGFGTLKCEEYTIFIFNENQLDNFDDKVKEGFEKIKKIMDEISED